MSLVQENRIPVDSLEWMVRQVTPSEETHPPVVLLHGLPTQSYSWRNILPVLASQGFRAVAPDWIGLGYSCKPAPFEFAYTPEAYITALGRLLSELGLGRFSLVVQGFLGTVGLQYALRYPDQIERLVILNAPLTAAARLPWKIRQLGLPLIGDMLTQDPLLNDRILEGGAVYQIKDRDLDVYRRPFLTSSDAGRALLFVVQRLQVNQVTVELEQGFAGWNKPTLVAWGMQDPWIPVSVAEAFLGRVTKGSLVKLDQVGHYPQEDWHEKVSEAMIPFLRRLVV